MKIACFADLHIVDKPKISDEKIKWIRNVIDSENPDVCVVAGDFVVHTYLDIKVHFDDFTNYPLGRRVTTKKTVRTDPYEFINRVFNGKKVVFCLGNHEFLQRSVKSTLASYKKHYNPEKYDAHCLDVIGSYVFGNVRFTGNVLWYDGSLTVFDPKKWEVILVENGVEKDISWCDREIKGFDPVKEHDKCLKQLEENYKDDFKLNVLVTHCIPHKRLSGRPESTLSTFSGVIDILKYFKYDICLCGHTHAVANEHIYGCKCHNIGNDYKEPWRYIVLEV